MHKSFPFLVTGIIAASFASAATVEEVGSRLEAGLQKEVDILSSVQDAASAASAVQPLRQTLDDLRSLNGLVPENDLWNYIDSTDGVKPRLIHHIQGLAKQFSRLEKEDFYGCAELEALLAPQLNRGAEKPAE